MSKSGKNYLGKLEQVFQELEYSIRYEKGNFQSGYCIVQHKNVAVVNKFFDTEGRISCLKDILASMKIENQSHLSSDTLKILATIKGSIESENLPQSNQ